MRVCLTEHLQGLGAECGEKIRPNKPESRCKLSLQSSDRPIIQWVSSAGAAYSVNLSQRGVKQHAAQHSAETSCSQ